MAQRVDEVEWMNAKITDEGVAEIRANIGVVSDRRPARITEEGIARFANAVGDDNPLWWDPDYAAKTRWGKMFAPPTLVYGGGDSRPTRPGESEMTTYTAVFLPGVFGMWVGDRWKFHTPAYAGEELHRSTALYDVQEKRTGFSGRTVLHTERTEYTSGDGRLIAELFRTLMRFERESARGKSKYLDIPLPSYNDDDWMRFEEQWDQEVKRRRGAEPRYWEDVSEGEELGTLLKGPLTVTSVVSYSSANGGSSPTSRLMHQALKANPKGRLINAETGVEDTIGAAHWDDYFARQSGLPRAYDLGGIRVAWVCHVLTDWMGDDGFITDLQVQLKRPNLMGDVTWLSGKVVGKRLTDVGDALVDCEITSRNQRDEQSVLASASVRLSRRPGTA
jgi:acyl dehydratase